ncbi:hypothetical protein F2Q68_00004734 [Brassica cretica]|uniref:Uncharacterized protein n=1 Tax=Brassica cretica TaxID=69181 RepID=A0A8S9JFS7_BRACR|nr:hypothetical protein F2Q68_00004734 [Brassica cretica]
MDQEARGGSIYEIRTWWQAPGSVYVKGSRRCCSTCNLYMQVDMWSTRWNGQARGVAMHATEACGQPCVRWCVDLHKLQSCSWPSGRGCVILHETETCSQPCGAQGVAAHASGAMRRDTRAAARLVPDWVPLLGSWIMAGDRV